jgi:hypothetical protein
MFQSIGLTDDKGGWVFPSCAVKDVSATGSHHDLLPVQSEIHRPNIGRFAADERQQADRPFAKQSHTVFGRDKIKAFFAIQILLRTRIICLGS